jgi:E3 ubiquitin-protein ligase SHPRH
LQAEIHTPSTATATALLHLLKAGHLVLGPASDNTPTNSHAPSTSQNPPVLLSLALSDAAVQDAATEAGDERQRPWQLQLLEVLHWLAPDLNALGDVAAKEEERVSSPRAAGSGNFDAAALYASIKPCGTEPELAGNFPELQPILRGYQRRAAGWMLRRETLQLPLAEDPNELHPLWEEVDCAATGDVFYINRITGRLSVERFSAPPEPKGKAWIAYTAYQCTIFTRILAELRHLWGVCMPAGAILADEMGLGKTVELLALILANKYAGPPPDLNRVNTVVRPQEERIDCVCGVAGSLDSAHSRTFDGLWVQCTSW